jgi:hypothetical protein
MTTKMVMVAIGRESPIAQEGTVERKHKNARANNNRKI